jgi:hypothetical protein
MCGALQLLNIAAPAFWALAETGQKLRLGTQKVILELLVD